MLTDEKTKVLVNETFRVLKIVCDEIIQNPSVESMNRWMAIVDNVNDAIFSQLWTYSMFPFQYHLCRHRDNDHSFHSSVLLHLLQCLKKGLMKICLDNVSQFIQFHKLLTEILTENKEKVTLKELPEDVKFSVVDCLFILNKNLSKNVVREIYDRANKIHLLYAHSVYICVQLAKFERYVSLRVVSLKCILAVIRIHDYEMNLEVDAATTVDIAETVASMLPGLVSMYYCIVTSSSVLHHNVYILSSQVFGATVALVFQAPEGEDGDSEFVSKIKSIVSEKKSCTSPSKIIRTYEWRKMTVEKLISPANCLINLCSNSHWKVRLEVAHVAKCMLLKCDHSCLMPVLSILLEVLIILSQDNMDQIRQTAKKYLSVLLQKDSMRCEKFFESFKERLFHILMSITSALNSINENVLLSQLNLLNGYIQILNSRRVFKSSVHLENLFLTLTKVVRFESSSVSVMCSNEVTDPTNIDLDKQPVRQISWRNMKYLSCETELAVKSICCAISESVDVESLILYLLDALENQPKNRKEIMYLINNILVNVVSEESTPDHVRLCKCILSTYLDAMHWCVPVSLVEEKSSVSSLASIHNNIIQACLLVEGVGNIALCLKEKFKPLLLHSLYKVVEKAGCSNKIIRLAANESLKRIANACNYLSVPALIADNVDYLTNTISWKLHNLQHNMVVFDVFCVIISLSQRDSLSTLLDIMETLLEGNSLIEDAYCEGFLRVFKSFTVKLRSWFSPIFKDDKSSINESNEKYFQFLLGLGEYVVRVRNEDHFLPGTVMNDRDVNLNDIFKNRDSTDMDLDDGEPTIDNEQNIPESTTRAEDDEDEENEKIPLHIELIASVGTKILHALPNKHVSQKALILDILADILLILSDRENQLLPLVHKIWSPLTNRLKYDNTDPLIMRRCFQLLCIMAVTSGDFIRKRTLSDALPFLTDFLSSSAVESVLKDKHSVYRTSQKYKFQLVLLNELGPLVVHVRLQEKDIYSVLVAATPYLSVKQPLPLQDACVNLFATIKSYNEDFVWIYLISVAAPEMVLRPQHSTKFNSIQLIEPENCKDLKKNSLRLLAAEN